MMADPTITWRDTIDQPWLALEPHRIGEIPSGLGTPAKYILLELDERPVLRVDAFSGSDEHFAFADAILWQGFLVVGWGNCIYLVSVNAGNVIVHPLRNYFAHIYAGKRYLLVASGDRLWRICQDGSIEWKSDVLGIDGVIVSDVTRGFINGYGEWDPPGGWRPFRISLDVGVLAARED